MSMDTPSVPFCLSFRVSGQLPDKIRFFTMQCAYIFMHLSVLNFWWHCDVCPGEGGGPINQPRRRIVTSSVRQDDDHTITLEATQDMLFMSPEGLPSEGDIAQMTQVWPHVEKHNYEGHFLLGTGWGVCSGYCVSIMYSMCVEPLCVCWGRFTIWC